MENNKEPQAQPQNPTPVMDIQPPRSVAAQHPNEPVPAPDQPTDEVSTDQPKATEPVLAARPPKVPSKTPYLAIFCAVIVAGVFTALAVIMYTSSDREQLANEESSQQPGTTQTDTATPTDVDETDKAIDDSMSSLDDAADYGDSAVSDTTLGL